MVNVFLSWSGNQSKKIAEELRVWIPSVLQFAKPYYTPNDIEKGAKWGSEISKQLSQSNVGIICLTRDNFTKPWILFEAGALSKDLDKAKVCSVLFGMENPDLSGPLTTFQTTDFSKVDFKKLMRTINSAGEDAALPGETFDRVFEKWWPDLEAKIKLILEEPAVEEAATQRSDRELLEEILLLSRERTRGEASTRFLPPTLADDLLKITEGICFENTRIQSTKINEHREFLLKITGYLARKSNAMDSDFSQRLEELKQKVDDFIPF